MTEKEHNVKSCELGVKLNKIRVREAKVELDQAIIREKAKLEARIETYRAAYDAALIDLDQSNLDLELAKDAAEKNFD